MNRSLSSFARRWQARNQFRNEFPRTSGLVQLLAGAVSGAGSRTAALSLEWFGRIKTRGRFPRRSWGSLLGLILLLALAYELKTSALQSHLLWRYARRASYAVTPGPSPRIVYPGDGPLDNRLGYARMPEFERRLEARGYRVTQQAVFSPLLARLADWGINPSYRAPGTPGLVIRGADGQLLYDARPASRVLRSYEEIPDLVVESLLFIEDRELGRPADPYSNPVIDWDRLAMAGLTYTADRLGLPVHVQGGSTLATQMEKYRHSRDGRTNSVLDKLRQMTTATLRVYRDGPDTRDARRAIVLDYLNTVPLGAAPGYGEIHGLGEGLSTWFGRPLDHVMHDLGPWEPDGVRAWSFKQVLTLLCAARAPTHYLTRDRAALEARVKYYVGRLEETGLIDSRFGSLVRGTPVNFVPKGMTPARRFLAAAKPVNAIRTKLLQQLGVPDLYALDRLDLDVETTLDPRLQEEVQQLLGRLGQPDFLAGNGLLEDRLLSHGDPHDVQYSVLLFERTPAGNALRVIADNLDQPLDLNLGMKLELGSTAKLRTLAHYLEVMEGLHRHFSGRDSGSLSVLARGARDPLSQWTAETLARDGGLGLDAFLAEALERRYSASPHEVFFTGGGAHTFTNFDSKDDDRRFSVRDGFVQSVNLVYVRLMRDLVRYHEARLPYDARAVLAESDNPDRRRMIEEVADEEARYFLDRAYRKYHDLPPGDIVERLLGGRAHSPRGLAVLFFAWNVGDDEEALSRWLATRLGPVGAGEVRRLFRSYDNPRLTVADYGYLLDLHPLDIWCAGALTRQPDLSWTDLLSKSAEARQVASAWLFETRNRRAQDLRLRIRIEEDAFARMTPYWQSLGFPFERLVPSYATAIGSSTDRPAALAELMGMIIDDGVLRPTVYVREMRFGEDTPYHTVVEPSNQPGERVMSASVARVLRGALSDVVAKGTARRAAGAFRSADGRPVEVGGKTGSGDNRFKTFNRHGDLLRSRPVNRTATFVFHIGSRYFGVITAFVSGTEADTYRFTSALPVTLLNLLAPAIEKRLSGETEVLEARARPPRRPAAGSGSVTLGKLRGSVRHGGWGEAGGRASRFPASP